MLLITFPIELLKIIIINEILIKQNEILLINEKKTYSS